MFSESGKKKRLTSKKLKNNLRMENNLLTREIIIIYIYKRINKK